MVKEALIFIAGGAIGSLITYMIISRKDFENKEKEISEIRSYYNNEFKSMILKEKELKNDEKDEKSAENEPNYVQEVKNIVKKNLKPIITDIRNSENGFENDMNEPKVKGSIVVDKSLISATEFAEDEDYDKVTLYYFVEDDLFTDIDYGIVNNGVDLVGRAMLDHVGMYEDDVLYVRNESLSADYEVIFQHNSYSEMFGE